MILPEDIYKTISKFLPKTGGGVFSNSDEINQSADLLVEYFKANPDSLKEQFVIFRGLPRIGLLEEDPIYNPDSTVGTIVHAFANFKQKDSKGFGVKDFDENFNKHFLQGLSEVKDFDINALDTKNRTALDVARYSSRSLEPVLVAFGARTSAEMSATKSNDNASASAVSSSASKSSDKESESSSTEQNSVNKLSKPQKRRSSHKKAKLDKAQEKLDTVQENNESMETQGSPNASLDSVKLPDTNKSNEQKR